MASTRSRITPKGTFKPKIRRIPLAPKNIPATNISNLDGNCETDCKWITIAVAATADKENKDVGRITASAGRDLQWRKREDASQIGPAGRRCSDDKWIIISLAEDKGSGKFVSNVDPGKVAFLPKNDMDASLAEELEMIRQKNERLRVERAKTDDIFKAKDQVMKRMEEQLELRWKAQERLEMELERLLSLKELNDCLLGFQPVVPLREKHRPKPKTGDPSQVKLENAENRVAVEATGDRIDQIL
ncbi:uncharacterized protein LOC116263212 isoform X2 [Nymphaea colorata]|nr:uncharacterized protein LOC116263212 isoform X2 [Nymphaea colorata]